MTPMTRRQLLIRIGVAAWAALPLAAPGQPKDKPLRVGYISFSQAGMSGPLQQSLLDALRQRGYVEGRNLVFERRNAEGDPGRVPTLASELADLKLDVIVTTCTPTTRATYKAVRSVPLVMAGVADPVGQGLIASYQRPGGNITGVASRFEEVAPKMLELLHDAVPKASPVAVLLNPRNAVHKTLLAHLETAAQSLKVRLMPSDVGLTSNFPALFEGLVRQGTASVMVLPDDPVLLHLRRRIVEQAAKHRLPSFFGVREAVEDGGLMSYGESLREAYARAGYYVDRIARGARPADLPVDQAIRFDLVVNERTARELGLTIPASVLARADFVIE
jgi:putative ABC transport system substrate-binding protein